MKCQTSNISLVALAALLCAMPCLSCEARDLAVDVEFKHGPQQPRVVPVETGLNIGRGFFFTEPAKAADEPDYAPFEGDSLTIHNGRRACNHILTGGTWWLDAGDKPRLRLRLRAGTSAYAAPALLDGIGVKGELRPLVTVAGITKELEQFDSIDAYLSAGSARWVCSDKQIGVTVELTTILLNGVYGFVTTARLRSDVATQVTLGWQFVGLPPAGVSPAGHSEMVAGQYSRVLAGVAENNGTVNATTTNVQLSVEAGKTAQSRLVVVWGYTGYDHKSVDDAYARLVGRPFADAAWLDAMKQRWFEHWVGRGLDYDKKFAAVLASCDEALAAAETQWHQRRNALRIQTPDARFDNAFNNTAAALATQYEYPAFIHGLTFAKYGKINCGYYGYEYAGLGQEVEDSLKFISGTQDPKGRMRYFTPAFAISSWCEEQNFYFVEQVWNHYRWSGDKGFVRSMWPTVRRALEQGLGASDPDGDGIMTGYYETWNCDTQARGGKCALWTGMAVAALRAAVAMAAAVDDRDVTELVGGQSGGSVLGRYQQLLQRSEMALAAQLWGKEVGAFCSAEWNGTRRLRPEVMEQNYLAWRGVGTPMQRYMAMRYVRDNFQLTTAPGVTIELINDWWPIEWSHHYVANGDASISALSAAKSGDSDNYWPSLKTISETLYKSDTATLCHGTLNDGRGSGMRQIVELEPQFVQAVAQGLFGIEPQFDKNLLVLEPALPGSWHEAQITGPDVAYHWSEQDGRILLDVTTPVERRVLARIPVQAEVLAATLNGREMTPDLVSAVGCCRVEMMSPAARHHRFEVRLGPRAGVSGREVLLIDQEQVFAVKNARILSILDPQEKMKVCRKQGADKAVLMGAATGRATVFLELAAGPCRWLRALDLTVQEPWLLMEKSRTSKEAGGAAVLSPAIDASRRTLSLDIANNSLARLDQDATIRVAGVSMVRRIGIDPGGVATLEVPLDLAWSRLSPGSTAVSVEMAGQAQTREALTWPLGDAAATAGRFRTIDLSGHYNIAMTQLYSTRFQWRHDYTGCGIGVDWRVPPPPRDQLGFVLLTPPVAQFEYQSLPEGWTSKARFAAPDLPPLTATTAGVPFRTRTANTRTAATNQADQADQANQAMPTPPPAGAAPEPARNNNILALACTEPYAQLPSVATLRFPGSPMAQKLYLLTANLTKTVKCYYPGAEIVVHYERGADQLVTLVPPRNLPMFAQPSCPRAWTMPYGTLTGDINPLNMGGNQPNLAVTDVLLDPTRPLRSIEFRCVATETILGILGATLLTAPPAPLQQSRD
jgi:hypothetical protein